MRRLVLALVLLCVFVLMAWLYAIEWPAAEWVVPGGALVLLVAAAIRGMQATRGRRVRTALAPATDALEGAQDIYLGRPGVAPEYTGASPVPTLIDDRDVPDLLADRSDPPRDS